MKNMHPSVWLVAAFLYWVCPLDFDFIPAIGFIDDIGVAILSIRKFRQGMRDREAQENKVIDVQPRPKTAARRIVEQDANQN